MNLADHRQGDGPPLVLIHGLGSHWQVWLPVLDLLAAERAVVALDLPGCGHLPMFDDPVRVASVSLSAAHAEAQYHGTNR